MTARNNNLGYQEEYPRQHQQQQQSQQPQQEGRRRNYKSFIMKEEEIQQPQQHLSSPHSKDFYSSTFPKPVILKAALGNGFILPSNSLTNNSNDNSSRLSSSSRNNTREGIQLEEVRVLYSASGSRYELGRLLKKSIYGMVLHASLLTPITTLEEIRHWFLQEYLSEETENIHEEEEKLKNSSYLFPTENLSSSSLSTFSSSKSQQQQQQQQQRRQLPQHLQLQLQQFQESLSPYVHSRLLFQRTPISYAIKIYSQELISHFNHKSKENPLQEIAALQYLNDNYYGNLLNCIETCADHSYLYSILKFYPGMELFDYLSASQEQQQQQQQQRRLVSSTVSTPMSSSAIPSSEDNIPTSPSSPSSSSSSSLSPSQASLPLLTEKDCQWIFYQLLLALQTLHEEKGMVHLDISLENILYTPATSSSPSPSPSSSSSSAQVVLIDFGMSKKLTPIITTSGTASSTSTSTSTQQPQQRFHPILNTHCGKRNYMAPEILSGKEFIEAPTLCDLWSAGICLLYLLLGFPPIEFASHNDPRYLFIIQGKLKELLHYWEITHLSEEVIDLLQRLLKENPEERLTISEMFRHPWLQEIVFSSSSSLLEEEEQEMEIESSPILSPTCDSFPTHGYPSSNCSSLKVTKEEPGGDDESYRYPMEEMKCSSYC